MDAPADCKATPQVCLENNRNSFAPDGHIQALLKSGILLRSGN